MKKKLFRKRRYGELKEKVEIKVEEPKKRGRKSVKSDK